MVHAFHPNLLLAGHLLAPRRRSGSPGGERAQLRRQSGAPGTPVGVTCSDLHRAKQQNVSGTHTHDPGNAGKYADVERRDQQRACLSVPNSPSTACSANPPPGTHPRTLPSYATLRHISTRLSMRMLGLTPEATASR